MLGLFPGLPTVPFPSCCWKPAASGLRRSAIASETDTAAARPDGFEAETEGEHRRLAQAGTTLDRGRSWVGGPGGPGRSRPTSSVAGIRRQLATNRLLLPAVKVKDNVACVHANYVIQMRGMEIGRYELMQGYELAISRPNRWRDPGQAGARSGLPGCPRCGSGPTRSTWRSSGYRRRFGQRDRHPLHGNGAAPRSRTLHAPGRETLLRPGCARESQTHRGFGTKTASLRNDPASVAEPAAGTGPDSRRRRHSRLVGEAAQITKNPLLSPNTSGSVSGGRSSSRCSIRKANCRPISSTRRSRAPLKARWSTPEWNSIASVSPRHTRRLHGLQSGLRIGRGCSRIYSAALPAPSTEANLPNLTVLSHNEVPPDVKVRSRGIIE